MPDTSLKTIERGDRHWLVLLVTLCSLLASAAIMFDQPAPGEFTSHLMEQSDATVDALNTPLFASAEDRDDDGAIVPPSLKRPVLTDLTLPRVRPLRAVSLATVRFRPPLLRL